MSGEKPPPEKPADTNQPIRHVRHDEKGHIDFGEGDRQRQAPPPPRERKK